MELGIIVNKIKLLPTVIILGLSSINTYANTGTINFNGVISAVTCETGIATDGSMDPTGTINFDPATVVDFEDGASSPVIGEPSGGSYEKEFTIAPINVDSCSATGATVSLMGSARPGYPDVLDGGQDVGFVVKFANGDSVLNKPNSNVEAANWDNVTKAIKFKANYFNTGTATPGAVLGSATYAIAYL